MSFIKLFIFMFQTVFLFTFYYLLISPDIKKLEFQYDMIEIANEENAMGYYKIRQQLQKLSEELLQFIHQPRYLLPFLQPGRLVHVSFL